MSQHAPAADQTPAEVFDVAVIGAGVVGCAMARRFALEGARVIVVEKAADILDGASKGNSGIMHTGFDAPVGSLEQRCIAAGFDEFHRIRERLNLPVLETSALVLAWNEEEEARLDALIDKARANGVEDIEPLTRAEILEREPALSPRVRGGFRVPREHVVDPWSTPHAYMLQALLNGATLLRGTRVRSGSFDGEVWTLTTSTGVLRARCVVNCAGLYGDEVDARLIGSRPYAIRPRKGQFVVFDKAASRLVTSILLPVPTQTTKGIVVCRTIYGNVLVGPTAEEQESRDEAHVDRNTLERLIARGSEILPGLAEVPVTATYAGLRPATDQKDYRIVTEAEHRYISVGGIRSTGLSSALGIAGHVYGLYQDFAEAHTAPQDPAWPQMPALAEHTRRDWAERDNGGIVCHCELVTRREVEQALSGPLAATSLAGLKRRTRVTMGRCQGFYCTADLAAITAGRLAEPMVPDTAGERNIETPELDHAG